MVTVQPVSSPTERPMACACSQSAAYSPSSRQRSEPSRCVWSLTALRALPLSILPKRSRQGLPSASAYSRVSRRAAASSASQPSAKRARWTDRPVISTVSSHERDIIAPAREAMTPAGSSGQRCMPNTRVT